MRARSILWGLVLGSALAGSPALGISFGYDFTGPDFNSPDFSLVGSAGWVTEASVSRLRLTPAAGGQVGNAWNNTAIDGGQAWNAEFTWQITFEGGGGADGLGFHLQEDGTGANTFFNGAGLSDPRLSVGIDTWNNGGEFDFALEVHLNGSQVGGEVNLAGLGGVADDVYQVIMSYDGAGNLTVTVDNTANANTPVVQNFAVNLAALDNAFFGWSANTGGSVENHDIRTFSGTFVIPEPGTGLLLAAGLLGLARAGRRRS